MMWMYLFIVFLITLYFYDILCEESVLSSPSSAPSPPNIIFILADDIGMTDFSYTSITKDISTPNIDFLANSGIQLTNYYVSSLCTPTRAAILTGRYAINTGLTAVLVPGTPAGLTDDIITLPELLYQNDYSTAMVGKWHLGHAQAKQTPTGKGFESFTGIYMWDVDSYTKQMYEDPFSPALMIDWTKSYRNGTFLHYAEPKHAMVAINDESIAIIKNHKKISLKPLFLYVAYTAAHSPLQPLPEHLLECEHITHLWRKQFCGMVKSIDQSVRDITIAAMEFLGPNTIILISSDNGGSPWFGGINYPYRGTKSTPFEGGIKVPGFIIELSTLSTNSMISSSSYLSLQLDSVPSMGTSIVTKNMNTSMESYALLSNLYQSKYFNRKFDSFFHASDWLPTLSAIANISSLSFPAGIDGFDLSSSLGLSLGYSTNSLEEMNSEIKPKLRTEMLLELYLAEDNVFEQDLFAYRVGEMKLIQGNGVRDSNYYYPSSNDRINSSSTTIPPPNESHLLSWQYWYELQKYYLETYVIETTIRFLSIFLDEGSFDGLRIIFTFSILHGYYAVQLPIEHLIFPSYYQNLSYETFLYRYDRIGQTQTSISRSHLHYVRLYNLTADPEEKYNLAHIYPDIVEEIRGKINSYIIHRPAQQRYWYQYHLQRSWWKTHVSGDCSINPRILPKDCRFTHPWIHDNEDPWKDSDDLVDGLLAAKLRIRERLWDFFFTGVITILIIITMYIGIYIVRVIASVLNSESISQLKDLFEM